MMTATEKRVTLFVGHYGSGKTNVAICYAHRLRRAGHPVLIGDLDIVNPYFRTEDSAAELAADHIRLVCSPFAGSNVDLAALPGEMYDAVRDRDTYAVLDIGGDERGALALGRYTPEILQENNYECLFVVNFNRPLTRTAAEAYEVMREITAAGGIPCTGIVHNTNLGAESDTQNIARACGELRALCEMSGLPVRFWSCESALAPALQKTLAQQYDSALWREVFPLTLQKKIG